MRLLIGGFVCSLIGIRVLCFVVFVMCFVVFYFYGYFVIGRVLCSVWSLCFIVCIVILGFVV